MDEQQKKDWYRYQLTYRFCWMCGNPLVSKYHEIDAEGKIEYCRDGLFPTKGRSKAEAQKRKEAET